MSLILAGISSLQFRSILALIIQLLELAILVVFLYCFLDFVFVCYSSRVTSISFDIFLSYVFVCREVGLISGTGSCLLFGNRIDTAEVWGWWIATGVSANWVLHIVKASWTGKDCIRKIWNSQQNRHSRTLRMMNHHWIYCKMSKSKLNRKRWMRWCEAVSRDIFTRVPDQQW